MRIVSSLLIALALVFGVSAATVPTAKADHHEEAKGEAKKGADSAKNAADAAKGEAKQAKGEAKQAEKKAEQVGTEIGVFAAGAEHGEQAESGSDRQAPAAARAQVVAVANHADGGQQSDRSEDGGGCANRAMGGVLQPGIGQVAEHAGRKKQEPCRSRA